MHCISIRLEDFVLVVFVIFYHCAPSSRLCVLVIRTLAVIGDALYFCILVRRHRRSLQATMKSFTQQYPKNNEKKTRKKGGPLHAEGFIFPILCSYILLGRIV